MMSNLAANEMNGGNGYNGVVSSFQFEPTTEPNGQTGASWEQLRLLTTRLQDVKEEEYSRLAYDIHETVGQSITALKLDLCWLEKKMGKMVPEVVGHLQNMNERIDKTIHTVRHIASQIRPVILDDMGLVEAVEWQTWHFSRQHNIQTKFFSFQDHLELDQKRTTALFRIFQETLANIAKHAKATKVWVNIHEIAGCIVLQVKDDGCGIADADLQKPATTGILNMRERARVLGGNVYIFGVPGKGTTTMVRMPNGKEDSVAAPLLRKEA